MAGGASELELGRECYERRKWADAYRWLALADRTGGLDGTNLERLATAAYLNGRDDEFLEALDRAHRAYLEAGECLRAVRCAFWSWLGSLFRGEIGRATGWLSRAQRLLERSGRDCVEHGYVLLAIAEHQAIAGDWELAHTTAARAAETGERFHDRDVTCAARHIQGRMRLQQGRIAEGLALLDEAMLGVTAGELSSIMTGLIYCSVIENCQRVYALSRAREWTAALARWCSEQPDMVAFSGLCLVHRSEILQLQGAWSDALQEASRASERCLAARNKQAAAGALYQQAEVHRLRGEFVAAEEAYRHSSQWGRDPQPGLALLRLSQGRTDVAVAAIRRALAATADRLERIELLLAHIEIMLAAGEIQEARDTCRELAEIAKNVGAEMLDAMVAQANGAVKLAEGDHTSALGELRRASQMWRRMDAPYMAGRVLVYEALACRAMADHDGCEFALSAARATFERLGAVTDLGRVNELDLGVPADRRTPLTQRELQVLRLVASGSTNKSIAARLGISEKTVDRHLSNIFNKLDVSSRAAATAYAYQNKLFS